MAGADDEGPSPASASQPWHMGVWQPSRRNPGKDDVGPSNLGNASASHGAATPLEKLDRAKSSQAINLSIEVSGPAVEAKGEFLQRGHVGEKGNSSIQGAYASRQAGQ